MDLPTITAILRIVATVFSIFWLIAALVILWLIWRYTIKHIRTMEHILLDVSTKNAESAQKAAAAAQEAVRLLTTPSKDPTV